MLPDDPEDLDPGLARERTMMAWARTAIAFAAVGAVMLKTQLAAGLLALAVTPLVWALGPLAAARPGPGRRGGRLLLVTVVVVAIAAMALTVAFIGRSPDGLRQFLPHG